MRRILSLVALAGTTSLSLACLCAVGRGRPMVHVDAEEVAIVYDARHEIEHFIRRASFSTSAPDFAFVAPTPGKPELGEADPSLFKELARFLPPPPASKSDGGRGGAGAANSLFVEVVHVQDVAGMRATVLRARNAKDLQTWLTNNGYATPSGFKEWVAPYLSGDWHLTAFKFLKKGEEAEVSSKAIRISFPTPRPYYPYRVPKGENTQGRRLRIYALLPYAASARTGRTPWTSHVHRVRLPEPSLAKVLALGGIDPAKAPENVMLNVFEDTGANRSEADGDLWMHPVK